MTFVIFLNIKVFTSLDYLNIYRTLKSFNIISNLRLRTLI